MLVPGRPSLRGKAIVGDRFAGLEDEARRGPGMAALGDEREALRRRASQTRRQARRLFAESQGLERLSIALRRQARLAASGLTPEEERALVCAAQRDGSVWTPALVDAYLPLIAGVARCFSAPATVDRDDLMQEGVAGLLHALRRYDPQLGTPFWAYASWWVRRGMQQLVAELARPVVLSDRAARELAQISQARRGDLESHGREPTTSQLATATAIERSRVERLVVAGRSGGSLSWHDAVADPDGENPIERIDAQVAAEQIEDLLAELPDRDRAVIHARYGIGMATSTLRQIGARLGLTSEAVRQIELRALTRLREGPGSALEPFRRTARRRSTSASSRRAERSARLDARSRARAGARGDSVTSRSTRRGRRSGTDADGPTARRAAGTPRSPRACAARPAG
jgi:RNA polymerase sigma factor (sigma-70 family)